MSVSPPDSTAQHLGRLEANDKLMRAELERLKKRVEELERARHDLENRLDAIDAHPKGGAHG